MQLSDKIISLRKKAGLSQEQLAEQLCVSRQTVSRWELGTAMPDAGNLKALSRLFGVTSDYLLNDDYRSDEDLPKVQALRSDQSTQILMYLVILEVMALLMQFMTVVILENVFFAVLSFLPFGAMVGGFEFAARKTADQATEQTRLFRKRLYKISAWLGTYFPVRLLVVSVPRFTSGSLLLRECLILALYVAAATLLDLTVEKKFLPKE